MTEAEALTEDTGLPIEKLMRLEEFDDSANPDIARFSRFVAARLLGRNLTTPKDFLEIASLAVYALEKDIDIGVPINRDLLGKNPEFYTSLYVSIPSLARVAFSEPFAEVVATRWQENLQRIKEQKEQQEN